MGAQCQHCNTELIQPSLSPLFPPEEDPNTHEEQSAPLSNMDEEITLATPDAQAYRESAQLIDNAVQRKEEVNESACWQPFLPAATDPRLAKLTVESLLPIQLKVLHLSMFPNLLRYHRAG